MTNQTPNPTLNEQEPFIPPSYMLILSAIGFVVALIVLFTQPTFSVVGWGGLGLGVLSLVLWGAMAPDQLKAILTGRTARYGGTTLIVTIVFIAALVAVYAFVKSRNIRVDLTQVDTYSLTEDGRQAIAQLALEPNVPNIRVIAFYGSAQASLKDQATLLFDDYAQASNNKISYEYVDPDRNPVLASQYEVTRAGTVVVVPLDDSGQPIADQKQTLTTLTQENLSNAILRVAASGDFRAYFLQVDDGLTLDDTGATGLSDVAGALRDQLNWKVEQISILDLANPASEIKLNDPTADGEVLVIPGGSKPLTDEQLKFITDFVDQGGDLVIFASPLNADGSPSLATAENLSAYLNEKFGVQFANDMVLDATQQYQTAFSPVIGDFDNTGFITQQNAALALSGIGTVFPTTHSIQVAPTLPGGVSVTELARSSENSYVKTDPGILASGDTTQADSDPKGPFVVAATAENSQTGSRVVLFGSLYVPVNRFTSGDANYYLSVNSFIWATRFEEFFTQIPQLATPDRPQDQPIQVTSDVNRNINFVTVILMPFGVLAIGFLVWWNTRERRSA